MLVYSKQMVKGLVALMSYRFHGIFDAQCGISQPYVGGSWHGGGFGGVTALQAMLKYNQSIGNLFIAYPEQW